MLADLLFTCVVLSPRVNQGGLIANTQARTHFDFDAA
jgi:hypothetical protein